MIVDHTTVKFERVRACREADCPRLASRVAGCQGTEKRPHMFSVQSAKGARKFLISADTSVRAAPRRAAWIPPPDSTARGQDDMKDWVIALQGFARK